MPRPALSVLMPVHNCEPYIRAAMESVLNQTFSDFEFIILDDGSTDGTWRELLPFQADSRVVLLRRPHQGFAASLNEGLKHCRAPLIARMDGDDICENHRFATQMAYMKEHPEIAVCGSWIKLFGDKEEVWHYRRTDGQIKSLMTFARTGFGHNAVMIRRDVFEQFQYEPEFDCYEDYRLWTSIAAKSRLRFANIQEVLVHYRKHAEQVSQKHKLRQNQLRREIMWRYLSELGVDFSAKEFGLFMKIRESERADSPQDVDIAWEFMRRLRHAMLQRFDDSDDVFTKYWREFLKVNDMQDCCF
jgi:glycosyltransferase involved in cell wall biosynthesis